MAVAMPSATSFVWAAPSATTPPERGPGSNFDQSAYAQGLRDVPGLLSKIGIACTVKQAVFQGDSTLLNSQGKSIGHARLYETACAEGLGYMLNVQGKSPPLAFDCIGGRAQSQGCLHAPAQQPSRWRARPVPQGGRGRLSRATGSLLGPGPSRQAPAIRGRMRRGRRLRSRHPNGGRPGAIATGDCLFRSRGRVPLYARHNEERCDAARPTGRASNSGICAGSATRATWDMSPLGTTSSTR